MINKIDIMSDRLNLSSEVTDSHPLFLLSLIEKLLITLERILLAI